MAKVKGLITFSGSLGGFTFVKSVVYGDHVRRKRGSVKPAVVNEAFRKSSEELRIATPYARMIKGSVNPYLVYFKDPTLWSRLRSFFRKQVRKGRIDYRQMMDFEFHRAHPLYSLLSVRPGLTVATTATTIDIALDFDTHPYFPVSYIDSYQLTLVVIMINGECTVAKTLEHRMAITPLASDPSRKERLSFPMDKQTNTIIVALKCEGCREQDAMQNQRTQGMAVVHVMNVREGKE